MNERLYNFPVIPGRERQLANPESIIPAAEYGFRVRHISASKARCGGVPE
jgi:hypothetical protein